MRYICVLQMPKNALVLWILPVRPLPQKFIYLDVCEALCLLLQKKKRSEFKSDSEL